MGPPLLNRSIERLNEAAYKNAKQSLNNSSIVERFKNNILNCQSMCKIFDYMVCSASAGGIGVTEVINLHNGNVFTSPTVAPKEMLDIVLKSEKYKQEISLKDISKKSNNPKFKIGKGSFKQVKDIIQSHAVWQELY